MTIKQEKQSGWNWSSLVSPVVAALIAISGGIIYDKTIDATQEVEIKYLRRDVDKMQGNIEIIQSDVKELLKTTQYDEREERTSNWPGNTQGGSGRNSAH